MKGFLKSKKARVLIIVLVILIVLIALIAKACSGINDAMGALTNMKEIQAVEVRDLSESISASGTVSGAQKNNVTSSASAEVTAVNVSVGDTVAQGDVLCTLDSSDIESQIAALQTSINNANAIAANSKNLELAALSRAQEDFNNVNNTLANDKNQLAAKQNQLNATSTEDPAYAELQMEVESLKKTVAADEEMVTSARRAVESAQNTVDMQAYETSDNSSSKELKTLQQALTDCVVTAPISGVVTAVNLSVGDNNTPNAVIFTIEDTSSMKIKVSIDEGDILKVEEGLKASITAQALGDEKLTGQVTRVIKVKDQSTGSATGMGEASTSGYSAEITVDGTDKLLIGMTGKVKIIIKERPSVLAVPYDLIQTDEDGKTYVLVAEADPEVAMQYSAVRKDVEVGEEVDYYTEILGGDLAEGDNLIVDYSTAEGDIFYSYDLESLGITE